MFQPKCRRRAGFTIMCFFHAPGPKSNSKNIFYNNALHFRISPSSTLFTTPFSPHPTIPPPSPPSPHSPSNAHHPYPVHLSRTLTPPKCYKIVTFSPHLHLMFTLFTSPFYPPIFPINYFPQNYLSFQYMN